MSTPQTKKVILLIVEGPSDKTALENAIRNSLKAKGSIHNAIFKVVHGDGTLKRPYGSYITSSEIIKATQALLLKFLKEEKDSGIRFSDVLAVAQITDLDACYASADHFASDPNLTCVTYDVANKSVLAPDGFDIAGKRDQKMRNLLRISAVSSIKVKKKDLPFQIFYFGIDLEHALHGQLNCDDATKQQLAEQFDDVYGEDPDGFAKKIASIPHISMEYRPSWKSEDLSIHAFDPLTNLDILFLWVQSLLPSE